jgi:predicted PurR-regulated permease PerM
MTSPPSFLAWLGSTKAQTRLLGVIAFVLTLSALRLSQAVVAPLVMAAFMVVVLWPIQARLQQRMPRIVATLLTLLIVLLGMVAFGLLFGWSVRQVAEQGPQLSGRFQELSGTLRALLSGFGLPAPAWLQGTQPLGERLSEFAPGAARWAYETAFALSLVIVYTGLGLYEVPDFEKKIRMHFARDRGDDMIAIAMRIAEKVRRFLVGVIISGTINAFAMIAFCLAVGLDLALLWGAIAFLLNFVMGIGPVIAVAPPVLYSVLQFDGLQRPLIVLLGVGTIQFLVNNVVEPKVEGRVVSLSPVLVLFLVLLWGWLWGGFGALLAVPITVAVVIVAAHFESSRWIAILLADPNHEAPWEDGNGR